MTRWEPLWIIRQPKVARVAPSAGEHSGERLELAVFFVGMALAIYVLANVEGSGHVKALAYGLSVLGVWGAVCMVKEWKARRAAKEDAS